MTIETNTKTRLSSWIPKTLLLSAGHFITDVYSGFLSPILPLLIKQYGFSLTFAGFLASISSFSNSLLQTVFGYLSDKVSYPFFIIIGPVIAAVFYSIIGYMPNKWFLLATIFVAGCGVAQFHPLGAILTNRVSTTRKGTAMSIFVTGGSIGYSLGPLVITTLISLKDIHIVPIAIIPAVFVSWLIYRFVPNHIENTEPQYALFTRENFRQIASIIIYITLGTLRGFVIMSFNAFVPILYSMKGHSLREGGFAIFIIHFCGGLGGLVGGLLTDRFPPKTIVTFSFFFASPALWIFLHTSGLIAYIGLGIAGAVLYSSIPAIITQAQSALPGRMGMASSLVMGVAWGLGGVMVIITGKLADTFGILPTLNIMALLPIAAFLLSLVLHRQTIKEETQYPHYI